MSNAQFLIAQLTAAELSVATLREQVAAALADAKQAIITELLEKIIAFGINLEDLFPAAQLTPAAASDPDAPRARKTVEPKYRNPETGATWTGRGNPPAWLAGKDKSQFLIVAPNAGAATASADEPSAASVLAVSSADAAGSSVSPANTTVVYMAAPSPAPGLEAVPTMLAIDAGAPTHNGIPASRTTREEVAPVADHTALTADAAPATAHLAFSSAAVGEEVGQL